MSRFAGWLAGLSVLGLAAAQGNLSQNLKLTLTQDLIRSVTQNGKTVEERISSPSGILPGAVLQEEVTAQNIAGRALGSFNLDVPLPPGTQFLGAATPSGARWRTQFTAPCGGKPLAYAEAPLSCTELVNGKSVTRQVKPSEYSNTVRWVVSEMKVGETLKFGFRVRVK